MTVDGTGFLRTRAYGRYSSTHAGWSDPVSVALAYRRDLRPRLPARPDGFRVLDVGCGQGVLTGLLRADGFDAYGVDISPEQISIAHANGIHQTYLGDFHEHLAAVPGWWHAIIATDVLEHLQRPEVLATFDRAHLALAPGGVFIARVPNAVGPMAGHVMYGDITHETWFTGRSVAQLAATAGFSTIRTFACPPRAHGVLSAARAMLWKPFSGLFKLALAAETGVLAGHIVTQNLTFVATKA